MKGESIGESAGGSKVIGIGESVGGRKYRRVSIGELERSIGESVGGRKYRRVSWREKV